MSQATSSKVSSNQISHITAQNRAKIVSFLFCLFTAQLGSYSKELLDSSCKVCSRLVLRSAWHNLKSFEMILCRGFEQRKPGYRSHQRNRSSGSEPGHRLGARTPQSRIFLPSAVYLDMLNLAYFAIFNQCGVSLNLLDQFCINLMTTISVGRTPALQRYRVPGPSR